MKFYTINTNNYIEDLQAPDWVEVLTDVEDLGDPEVVNNRGLLGMKVGKDHKVGRKKQHPTIDTENYNAFNFRRQLSKITKVSVKLK